MKICKLPLNFQIKIKLLKIKFTQEALVKNLTLNFKMEK